MANGRAAAPALGWGAQAPRGASGICLVPVWSLSSAALATAKPAQGGQARACAVQPPRSPTGGLPEVWPLAPAAYSHPGSRRSSGYLWQGCLRRLFGDFLVFRFFFPFFLLSPPPTFHARAGLTVSAVASPPPCRFLGHPPELGLAVLRAARAAALAGGAAGPCSALRLGRRWVGSPEGMHACRPCSPAGRAKLFWDWRCVLRGRESLALPCGSRTRGVPRVLDLVKNVGAAGFSLIPSSL